jgi:hypothetical protein
MDQIMGPQAVNRIYSEEDINGYLHCLNKRISEGEAVEVVKNISNCTSTSDTLFAELFKYSRMHNEEGKILRISSYRVSCVVCLIVFFTAD